MKIDHVAMYVRDLERAKDFFMRYFGAKSNELYHNQKTGFRSYFLTFDQKIRGPSWPGQGLSTGPFPWGARRRWTS